MPLCFPPLPDGEAGDVLPHPDGQAWRKACPECAFRSSDPQGMGRQYQDALLSGSPGTLFYCVHRLSDGYNRVCACYAAFHPEQQVEMAESAANAIQALGGGRPGRRAFPG